MKQWIKTYKWQLLLSTLLGLVYILAGVILWDRLPERMVSHWGADGAADGMASKGFMVFGVGGIVLGLHILCVLLARVDKNTHKQNKKAASIIFWIVPWIGVFIATRSPKARIFAFLLLISGTYLLLPKTVVTYPFSFASVFTDSI